MRLMDHRYIEEHNVANRYLTRELDSDERARFEEHFVDCAECLDRIALAEIFREPPRETNGGRVLAPPLRGPFARLGHLPPRQQVLLTAFAMIALAGAPIAFFAGHALAIRQELAQQSEAAAAWQQSYEEARRDGKLFQPSSGASVYALGAGLSIRIPLSIAPQELVLLTDIEAPASPVLYRVTIYDSAGKMMWTQSGLRPVPGSKLGAPLMSSVFEPGMYTLEVDSQTLEHAYARVAAYSFQVTRQ